MNKLNTHGYDVSAPIIPAYFRNNNINKTTLHNFRYHPLCNDLYYKHTRYMFQYNMQHQFAC